LREYAAYGEASYAFDGGWKVTVGARAFKVDQTFYQEGDGVLNGGTTAVNSSSSDHGVNPKLTVSKQIGADDLVYFTASKGYRPGGPNNPAPASVCGSEVSGLGLSQSQLTKYGSDNLWNYELGAKTGWLDHRLTVNGFGVLHRLARRAAADRAQVRLQPSPRISAARPAKARNWRWR